jgi:hypothetical protein
VKVMGIGRLGVADMGKLQTTVFTITGQGEKSAIRSVVPLSGKAYTASGVAVVAHGDWLVVVRLSSMVMDAGQLGHDFDGVHGQVGAERAQQASARGLSDCSLRQALSLCDG